MSITRSKKMRLLARKAKQMNNLPSLIPSPPENLKQKSSTLPSPPPAGSGKSSKPPKPPPIPKKVTNLDEVKEVPLFKSKQEEMRILQTISNDEKFPIKPAEYLVWRMIPDPKLFGGLVVYPKSKDGMRWNELHSTTGLYTPEAKMLMKKFLYKWMALPDSRKFNSIKKVYKNNAKTFPNSRKVLMQYSEGSLKNSYQSEAARILISKDPQKYGELMRFLDQATRISYLTKSVLPTVKTNKDIPNAVSNLFKSASPAVQEQLAELAKTNNEYAESLKISVENDLIKLLAAKVEGDISKTILDNLSQDNPNPKSETDRVLNNPEVKIDPPMPPEGKTKQPPPAPTSPPPVPTAENKTPDQLATPPVAPVKVDSIWAKPLAEYEAEFSSIVKRDKASLKDVEKIVKAMLDSKDQYRALRPDLAERYRVSVTKSLKKFYVKNHAFEMSAGINPDIRVDIQSSEGQSKVLSAIRPQLTQNQNAIVGESVVRVLGNKAGLRGAVAQAVESQPANLDAGIGKGIDPKSSFCTSFNNLAQSTLPQLNNVAVNVDPSILGNAASMYSPVQLAQGMLVLPQGQQAAQGSVPIAANQLAQMMGNPLSLLSMPQQSQQGMLQLMALSQTMGQGGQKQYKDTLSGLQDQIASFSSLMNTMKALIEPIMGPEMAKRFEYEQYQIFMNKFLELFMQQTLASQFNLPMANMSLFTQMQQAQTNPNDAAFIERPEGVAKVAASLTPTKKFAIGLVKEMTTPKMGTILSLVETVSILAK